MNEHDNIDLRPQKLLLLRLLDDPTFDPSDDWWVPASNHEDALRWACTELAGCTDLLPAEWAHELGLQASAFAAFEGETIRTYSDGVRVVAYAHAFDPDQA